MPFAAALAVGVALAGAALTAAELAPDAAYRAGDFPRAEKAWRARIATTPTDWIARHNLSLALAQQERPAESAAQAAAAFVQHPGDPAVRWHFTQALERSGLASPTLAAFLSPSPRHTVARILSPATWQWVLIGAMVLATVATGLLLRNAYHSRQPAHRETALALLLLAAVMSGCALSSLAAFGGARHPDAVIIARSGTLRSIPTEADTTQKTTALAPGALALVDNTFLDGRWVRLAFENGQTGWVRRDDVVALWK